MPSDPLAAELARLVAYPTVSDRPLDGLGGYLAERLESLGFRVERVPDAHHPRKFSLVGRCGPEDPTNGLTLSGHMDVVPTEGQPWSSDPFLLAERDGRLFGRGSADMKGFFAATLFALDRLQRRELTRQVAVVFTHDEEVGCLGSAQIADTWGDQTPLPEACVIGEPTDFQILRMHPGHAVAEIEIRGKAAHSSMPQKGVNAIAVAARVVQVLQDLAAAWTAPRSQFFGTNGAPWAPLNVARIQGGSAVNIVPDHCTIQVGFRPPPGTSAESLFTEMVRDVVAVEPDAAVRLVRVTPSLLTPLGTPLESLLHRFASTPDIGMASFATDGGQLARIGLAPLIFGPGSIEVAHRADEYVEAAALHRAVDVLEAVIRARCA